MAGPSQISVADVYRRTPIGGLIQIKTAGISGELSIDAGLSTDLSDHSLGRPEGLADKLKEVRGSVWFLKYLSMNDPESRANEMRRVRRVNNPDPRTSEFRDVRQLEAVQSGQEQVGEQESDLCIFLEQSESLIARGGRYDAIVCRR
jgi:hypothetical protein